MKRLLPLLAVGTALGVFGCAVRPTPPAEWLQWQDKRRESVAGTNGWLTLVGLHWLKEGTNTVGSNPANDAVLPGDRAPARVGVLVRQAGRVSFEAATGCVVTESNRPVQSLPLVTDLRGRPTRLEINTLTLTVIERGDRLGLRVRDRAAPARAAFQGLAYFPYDQEWRLEGRFELFPEARELRVPDVTGNVQKMVSPGAIVFRGAGSEHRLDVVEEPDEEDYFVNFRDRTAGGSTYAAGRFLYVARPASDGRVTIDFNRAYNPPCAFTPFATCPLPPPQNRLPLSILAGERKLGQPP